MKLSKLKNDRWELGDILWSSLESSLESYSWEHFPDRLDFYWWSSSFYLLRYSLRDKITHKLEEVYEDDH